MYPLLVVHFGDERMVYLGDPNVILVDLFISETELSTQTQPPAVEAAILCKKHRMLLACSNSHHIKISQ